MASTRAKGHAPWSASKVQTALQCPRLFHFRYVDKVKEPETMPETRIGKAIHKALEKSISGTAVHEAVEQCLADLETDEERQRYRHLCDGIQPFLKRLDIFHSKHRFTRPMIEYTMAITEDKKPTSFYSKNGYFRGIVDLALQFNGGKCAVVDHKSGQKHPHRSIFEQLDSYAVLTALTMPHIRKIYLGIHWVSDQSVDWSTPVDSELVKNHTTDHVFANIEAAALAVDDGPRPNPTSWCLRCSYRSICDVGQSMRYQPIDEDDPFRS